MQSMKGATMLLGSMNRQMNLPALQRIAMEFERENEVMDERQEMMDDAIDEATGMEGEEEEGEDIVKEVLDEIGVDLGSAVCPSVETPSWALCADQLRTSLVKLRQIYINRKLPRRLRLHKPWVLVAAEATRATTTYRRDWTAFDDDGPSLFPLSTLLIYILCRWPSYWRWCLLCFNSCLIVIFSVLVPWNFLQTLLPTIYLPRWVKHRRCHSSDFLHGFAPRKSHYNLVQSDIILFSESNPG